MSIFKDWFGVRGRKTGVFRDVMRAELAKRLVADYLEAANELQRQYDDLSLYVAPVMGDVADVQVTASRLKYGVIPPRGGVSVFLRAGDTRAEIDKRLRWAVSEVQRRMKSKADPSVDAPGGGVQYLPVVPGTA